MRNRGWVQRAANSKRCCLLQISQRQKCHWLQEIYGDPWKPSASVGAWPSARDYSASAAPAQPRESTRPPGGVGIHWMRSSAQRADSAIAFSEDSASLPNNSTILNRSDDPCSNFAFPNAMHAFLTNPFHFALFIALPRNFSRNSSSLIPASHSNRGSNKLSLAKNRRGSKSGILVTGAFRLCGHTSWQISQPYTLFPIASRNSSGTLPRNSIVK